MVAAQPQPTPDTLDWRRYYPLAVGNVWEYQVAEGEPLLRREIIGETLALGREYFLMDETAYDYDYLGGGTELEVFFSNMFFVRYDTSGTVVALRDVESDTSAAPRSELSYATGDWYFDLRMAFGDTVRFGAGEADVYSISGGYGETVEIGNAMVVVAAHKFFQGALGFESYAADIGFLGGGNLWGPHITYSRVEGVEYGISRTPVRGISDTLDWHGYFPLGAGATWQYRYFATDDILSDQEWYKTLTVIGDTVFEDRSYVIIESTCVTTFYVIHDPCQGVERAREYVRYDEPGSNVLQYAARAYPQEWRRFTYDFRLDADFNTEVTTEIGFRYRYASSAEAFVEPDTIATTVKLIQIDSAIPGGLAFAHGIGFLGSSFCEGGCLEARLVYSLIGEQRYGEYRPVAVEPTARLPERPSIKIYPQPASTSVTVEYEGVDHGVVRLLVFDELGRKRTLFDLGSGDKGLIRRQIDVTGLASGVYVVTLQVSGQVTARQQMVVLR